MIKEYRKIERRSVHHCHYFYIIMIIIPRPAYKADLNTASNRSKATVSVLTDKFTTYYIFSPLCVQKHRPVVLGAFVPADKDEFYVTPPGEMRGHCARLGGCEESRGGKPCILCFYSQIMQLMRMNIVDIPESKNTYTSDINAPISQTTRTCAPIL